MLKGTLDMMILRTLVGGDAHGHTIAKVIEHTSEDLLEVEQGSLYPALHRLEDRSAAGASESDARSSGRCIGNDSSGNRILGYRRIHGEGASSAQAGRTLA
jgi:hypothetical protein